MRMRPYCLVVLAAVACSPMLAAERWRVQFFHDKDDSSLSIVDLNFPSTKQGIAVGQLVNDDGDTENVALVTSDGGETWTFVKLKEQPVSLFFLSERLGWMVASRGIWKTGDGGRNWKKAAGLGGMLRAHFLDENHGFAVGPKKAVYETNDGGTRWTEVAAAAEPKVRPEYSWYGTIAFADSKSGMIAGASEPPRRERRQLPDWMDPEAAARRKQWPTVSIALSTRDGGKTWTSSVASMFGRITRVSLRPDGTGLGLIEFTQSFDYPSEVFSIDTRSGKSTRVYRAKDRAVTDVVLLAGGTAYVAAIERVGSAPVPAVPGKLKIQRSDDLANWRETEVDYRAEGTRATLAAADAEHIWVATDTGMILRLEGR